MVGDSVEYLEFAVQLARAAGDILNFYSTREKNVEHKGRANLVTVADRESEALIIQEIRARDPDHTILSEESGLLEESGEGRWIIDPLDGTTNYAHNYPLYCVSIGFEKSNQIVCGAVYDPVRDEMFTGARGEGAFVNGEAMTVSGIAQLADGLLLTGFPYGVRGKIDYALGLFKSFLITSQAIRRGGSAALDLCHLAAGRCDGFWELDLNPWDTAAGLVIAEEAGARVTGFLGQKYSVYYKEILASNELLHEEMVAVVGTQI